MVFSLSPIKSKNSSSSDDDDEPAKKKAKASTPEPANVSEKVPDFAKKAKSVPREERSEPTVSTL